MLDFVKGVDNSKVGKILHFGVPVNSSTKTKSNIQKYRILMGLMDGMYTSPSQLDIHIITALHIKRKSETINIDMASYTYAPWKRRISI